MTALPKLDPIGHHVPGAGPEEKALRVRIHKARDVAQSKAMRSSHDVASALYWLAVEVAGAWVFRRAPTEDLEEDIKVLTGLFLAAGEITRIEAADGE